MWKKQIFAAFSFGRGQGDMCRGTVTREIHAHMQEQTLMANINLIKCTIAESPGRAAQTDDSVVKAPAAIAAVSSTIVVLPSPFPD